MCRLTISVQKCHRFRRKLEKCDNNSREFWRLRVNWEHFNWMEFEHILKGLFAIWRVSTFDCQDSQIAHVAHDSLLRLSKKTTSVSVFSCNRRNFTKILNWKCFDFSFISMRCFSTMRLQDLNFIVDGKFLVTSFYKMLKEFMLRWFLWVMFMMLFFFNFSVQSSYTYKEHKVMF